MKYPPKWIDIYPQGTKKGDEEQAFFTALARHPKWEWRSTSALIAESGLEGERVEELILKYEAKNMVFQNPLNDEMWGYWERVPQMLQKNNDSITMKDHDDRIKKALK